MTAIHDGDESVAVPEGLHPSLRFDDGGSVAIDTGCNFATGIFEVTSTGIRIRDFVQTLAGCPHEGERGQVISAMSDLTNGANLRIRQFSGYAEVRTGQLTLRVEKN